MDKHGFHRHHQLPTDQDLKVMNSKVKDLGVFLHEHEWKVEQLDEASFPEPRQSERPV
jgi:hypothetical protein